MSRADGVTPVGHVRSDAALASRKPAIANLDVAEEQEEAKGEVRPPESAQSRTSKIGSLSPMRQAVAMRKRDVQGTVIKAAEAFTKYDTDRRAKECDAQLKALRWGSMIVGLAGLGLAVLEAELRFDNNDDVTAAMNGIKVAISCLTAVLLAMVLRKYVVDLRCAKLRGHADPEEGLLSNGRGLVLLTEVLLCAPHPFPWVHAHVYADNFLTDATLDYTLDALLSGWMVLRLYLCFPVMDDLAGFRSLQAKVIARFNGVTFNTAFTFKAIMDSRPISVICVILLVAMVSVGYWLRVLERPVCGRGLVVDMSPCAPGRTYEYFGNCLWNVFITMTTVGYGDVFPSTTGGRVVAMVACLLGVIVIALLVTAVTSASAFSPDERRAFLALNRTTIRLEHRQAAARVAQQAWKYYRALSARYKTPIAPVPRIASGSRVTVVPASTIPNAAASAATTALPHQASSATMHNKANSANNNGNNGNNKGNAGSAPSSTQSVGAAFFSAVATPVATLRNRRTRPHHVDAAAYQSLLSELASWRRIVAEHTALHQESSEVGLVQRDLVALAKKHDDFRDEILALLSKSLGDIERNLLAVRASHAQPKSL